MPFVQRQSKRAFICGVSGGLLYHYSALRYRHTLWSSYHQSMTQWLNRWRPPTDHLVLIGPSAGYSLNQDFLTRFQSVIAVDPDPVAHRLFRRRFPSVPTRWITTNYFSTPSGRFNTQAPADIAQAYPDRAILFCNLLGQLPLLFRGSWDEGALKASLTEHWKAPLWASYHDLYSSSIRPSRIDNEPHEMWASSDQNVEVRDHLTRNLCPSDLSRQRFLWQLRPNEFHVIEAVAQT